MTPCEERAREHTTCSEVLQPVGRPAPSQARTSRVVRNEPHAATIEPVVRLDLERVEVLALLGMTLAHLYDAEARVEISPRVPLLMAIRDKLVSALTEDG